MSNQQITDRIITLYRKRAGHYDYTANLYYLIGFREWKYRKMAVAALDLHPGDTAVEIGCGTGLNFPLLQAEVGSSGRIIGVDLTDAMLAQAQKRVDRHGWSNVELVQSDAAAFQFPAGVHGILSTFALTLIPEYDRVIQNGANALAPGKRWVVLDLKLPAYVPARLGSLLLATIRPFIVSDEYLTRRPWESMRKHLTNVLLKDLYFGFAYIAIGEREGKGQNGDIAFQLKP